MLKKAISQTKIKAQMVKTTVMNLNQKDSSIISLEGNTLEIY